MARTDQGPVFCRKDRKERRKPAAGKWPQNNASKVVREALRLMHERDQRDAAKLERLRSEATLGFEALKRGEISQKSVGQIFDEVRPKRNK